MTNTAEVDAHNEDEEFEYGHFTSLAFDVSKVDHGTRVMRHSPQMMGWDINLKTECNIIVSMSPRIMISG